MKTWVAALACGVGLTSSATTVLAQTESIATNASGSASYPTFTQSAGPFPWTDLGVTASASISPGTLNANVGGATAFNLPTGTVSNAETFIPGSTTLDLGYNANWTGSVSASATGTLSSQLVYKIGPFSGAANLLHDTITNVSAGNDLSASLNSGSAGGSGSATNGASIGTGFTISAQAFCPFCVTVASASVGLKIGSQVQQTLGWSPTVTYGDLIWYSKSQTLSAGDTTSFVAGSAGTIMNTFMTPPASLGLKNGDQFFMNFLPVVRLDLPISNSAAVTVPAGVSANWNVFGVTGSASWSGNLYSLGTGTQSYDFNPTWYAPDFYSVPLDFTEVCGLPGTPCSDGFVTPNGLPDPVQLALGGIPGNSGPDPFTGGPWPGLNGPGFGDTNLGPLIPGDTGGQPVCDPTGRCVNNVVLEQVPEPGTFGLMLLGLIVAGPWLARRARA